MHLLESDLIFSACVNATPSLLRTTGAGKPRALRSGVTDNLVTIFCSVD